MAAVNRRAGSGEGGDEEEAIKALKEGEKILAPTRRPDGSVRKPIRIRAGYVPQDEVAVYKSKPSQFNKETLPVPPGYDPKQDLVNKSKTKSAKRNERKKEKRLQAASDNGKNEVSSTGDVEEASGPVESIVSQINEITISGITSAAAPPSNSTDSSATGNHVPDIDKRIRALKKKIRLTEAQQQKTGQDLNPEQVEKVAKLEDWCIELKLLEEKKASMGSL